MLIERPFYLEISIDGALLLSNSLAAYGTVRHYIEDTSKPEFVNIFDNLGSIIKTERNDIIPILSITIGSFTKLPCQYSECTADYRKYSEIYN